MPNIWIEYADETVPVPNVIVSLYTSSSASALWHYSTADWIYDTRYGTSDS
jgi:hypothetical protein